jgi:hypothetical protein
VTQIGSHGLSCIGDDDYAAYALSMQCNAQAIDSALDGVSDSMAAAAARPWLLTTNATSIVVDDQSGGGTVGPNGVVGEVLYPQVGSSVTTTASGLPTQFLLGDASTFWPKGIFLIGATVKWSLAAATADSIRQLSVYGMRQINGSTVFSTNYTDLYHDEDYQNDGGNTGALSVTGLLDTRAGDVTYVQSFFTHTNVAGDLTIAVGSWRVWATYLGSGLTI